MQSPEQEFPVVDDAVWQKSHLSCWPVDGGCLSPTLSGQTPVDFTGFHQIPLDSTGLNVWWVTIQSFQTGLDFQSSGVW